MSHLQASHGDVSVGQPTDPNQKQDEGFEEQQGERGRKSKRNEDQHPRNPKSGPEDGSDEVVIDNDDEDEGR